MEIVRLPNVNDRHKTDVADNKLNAGLCKVLPFPTGGSPMQTPKPARSVQVLDAPARLVAATRLDFRKMALQFVEQVEQLDMPAIVIDMRDTVEIDASGLGILVLVQKRAREVGRSTQIRRASEQVRRVMALTRLEPLFEFVD
jgi:anti-anti-sigma factor